MMSKYPESSPPSITDKFVGKLHVFADGEESIEAVRAEVVWLFSQGVTVDRMIYVAKNASIFWDTFSDEMFEQVLLIIRNKSDEINSDNN